jgi:hypothetical protein
MMICIHTLAGMLKQLLLFVTFFAIGTHAWSQGCSDAGFCTMGAMKPDQPFNKKMQFKLRSMEVSFYRGTTTTTPVIYVATADLNFGITARSSFQIKVPYLFVRSGNLGETNGVSDLSLCYTRSLYTSEKFDLNFSVGGKIPTNQADKTSDLFPGEPLPMYYQTSLGTYDFITGLSLINRKWLLATGIQIPMIHNNNNTFDWTDFPDYPDQNYLRTYSQSNQLKRGIDVMLRVERNFRFSRLNFSVGLLPIYRITNDKITLNSEQIKPEGAQGLALSGIVTAGYNFNVQSGVKLLVGHKIVQRDTNPDGLTRVLVSSISYYYRF